MTVVNFPRPAPALPEGWHTPELQQFAAATARSIAAGEASGWDVGATEKGDPQVYLIGPAPDYDCILSISRLGRLYVVEDGAGRVLFEQDSPAHFAEHALAALHRHKAALVARLTVAWWAAREIFEDKTDAMTEEAVEILAALAPQLAALV